MAGKCLAGAAAIYFLMASLVPAAAQANNLAVNAGTRIPVRPHVNFNTTINLGVKARTFHDVDLSEACPVGERIRSQDKRAWRCHRER